MPMLDEDDFDNDDQIDPSEYCPDCGCHLFSEDHELDCSYDDDELDENDEDLENEDDWGMTPAATVSVLARAAAEGEAFMRNGLISMPRDMRCRHCGCTDDRACAGGCFWVAPNLCSRCVSRV